MDFKILILVFLTIIALTILIVFLRSKKKDAHDERKEQNEKSQRPEIDHQNIEILADYVKNQKDQMEAAQKLKDLKKVEMKQKLEVFKQTRDILADKLKTQIDAKDWKPLESILKNVDKGGIGIYILHNETKDKYYVGQAKQLYKRIRAHFAIEDIAVDFLSGDKIQFKVLTANELDADYRMDHIEKTGIDIFSADKTGYNKTSGNL